jgi:hypothetical protein
VRIIKARLVLNSTKTQCFTRYADSYSWLRKGYIPKRRHQDQLNQVRCSRQDDHDLIIPVAASLARGSELFQHQCVEQAAGVAEQVADRDPAPVAGPSGMYFPTSSSSESLPCCAGSKILMAVNW